MQFGQLVSKYNIAGPRYTSYPTVPFWNTPQLGETVWKQQLTQQAREKERIPLSLYLHLPFCSSLCHFCGCNKKITRNHGEERPYILRLLREWKLYNDLLPPSMVIAEMHLGGGTPTFFSAEHLGILMDGILSNTQLTSVPAFSFEAHPNSTDKQKIKVLYDRGFRRISLGIQDYNEEVQRAINRRQTDKQIQDVVYTARDMGYESVNFDLIYGLPLQYDDRLKNTIEKTIQLLPDRIAFYSYAHVPWVSKAQRLFSEADLPDAESKMQLYLTGKKMLLDAGYKEIGMDHFALPHDSLYQAAVHGTLHRNFMGYTDCHTDIMLGLGVSSISDANGVFAQNYKSLMEYERAIDAGIIPVFRGHLPDEADRRHRKIILDLMCRFEAKINPETTSPTRPAMIHTLTAPLEADGLCFWDGDILRVTDTGRQFVRNVCMTVDPYLLESGVREKLFSKTI